MLLIMVLQWVDAFQLLAGALLAQPSIASPASSQPPPFSAQLMLFCTSPVLFLASTLRTPYK